MADRLTGMDAILALFDNLPAATEQELKQELPAIGGAALAAQRAAVPVRSGALQGALDVQVLAGGLTVRVGLLDLNAAYADRKGRYGLCYGRFVEFGRTGQVVAVERRRRVGGRLRTTNRRKRASDIVSRYSMKVAPMAPRPFVNAPAAQEAALDAAENLADFWSKVLGRAGASQ